MSNIVQFLETLAASPNQLSGAAVESTDLDAARSAAARDAEGI